MGSLKNKVVEVIDSQIAYLAERTLQNDQETRVSIFYFENSLSCHTLDKDVLRLPSIKDTYRPYGGTALLDATSSVLVELRKTPETIGDHAFLMYVITDGEDNCSKISSAILRTQISALPDNWTLGVFVPDITGMHAVKTCGFPANNIAIWEVKECGLEKAGEMVRETLDNFMDGRVKGIRATKTLFTADLEHVDTGKLEICHPSTYALIDVSSDDSIKTIIESTGLSFIKGNVFYQLLKKEKISSSKEICILEKTTQNVYAGNNARSTLGLPIDQDIALSPVQHDKYELYIQSTSYNRKVSAGSRLFIKK